MTRVVVITPAQRRVLGELTRDGASNAVIARRLGVSVDAVKSHLKEIGARTGLRGRTTIAVACLRKDVLVRTIDKRELPL